MEVDLQRRLDERPVDVSWSDLMRDLEEVRAVDLTRDGPRYRLRTDLVGSAHHASLSRRACGHSRSAPAASSSGDTATLAVPA